jgi:hypothetical protein
MGSCLIVRSFDCLVLAEIHYFACMSRVEDNVKTEDETTSQNTSKQMPKHRDHQVPIIGVLVFRFMMNTMPVWNGLLNYSCFDCFNHSDLIFSKCAMPSWFTHSPLFRLRKVCYMSIVSVARQPRSDF